VFPTVYPITDVEIAGVSHAEQVVLLADGGAKFVQLREKNLPALDFYNEAKAALVVALQRGVTVIINDRVDLALALRAGGVHLGQDDLPPQQARSILGPNAVIGFSTHNMEQALRADEMPIDYIAVGPIYSTTSKENPAPVLGVAALREICGQLRKPVVAIGGITLENAASVLRAGAVSVAVISDLLTGGEPSARVQAYVRDLAQHRV